MGLWCLAWSQLVPAPMGPKISSSSYHDKRNFFQSSWHARVWGPTWGSNQVVCLCDNQAVVACLRSRTSRVAHVMHMLRTLAFLESWDSFALSPQYIDTKSNHLADDLLRNLLSSFNSAGATAGPSAGSNSGLGLAALAPVVQRYFSDGLGSSTRRSYDSAMKRFTRFCDRYRVLDPFPVTEGLLHSFAADADLAPQTVKSYLAAIRNTQVSWASQTLANSHRCPNGLAKLARFLKSLGMLEILRTYSQVSR